MQLLVKTLNGTRCLLFSDSSVSVSSVKARLQDSEGIPVGEQRLVCNTKELPNDAFLDGECGSLSMLLRIVGGKVSWNILSWAFLQHCSHHCREDLVLCSEEVLLVLDKRRLQILMRAEI